MRLLSQALLELVKAVIMLMMVIVREERMFRRTFQSLDPQSRRESFQALQCEESLYETLPDERTHLASPLLPRKVGLRKFFEYYHDSGQYSMVSLILSRREC